MRIMTALGECEKAYSQTIANTQNLQVDREPRNGAFRDGRVLIEEVATKIVIGRRKSRTLRGRTYAANVGP